MSRPDPAVIAAIKKRKEKKALAATNPSHYLTDPDVKFLFYAQSMFVKVRTGRLGDAIYTSFRSQYEDSSKAMVLTGGTVGSMVDYYLEGSAIRFESPDSAEKVYDLIEQHLVGELDLLNKNHLHEVEDMETLMGVAEFSLALYPQVYTNKAMSGRLSKITEIDSIMSTRVMFKDLVAERKDKLNKNFLWYDKTKTDIPIPPTLELFNKIRTLSESRGRY